MSIDLYSFMVYQRRAYHCDWALTSQGCRKLLKVGGGANGAAKLGGGANWG